MRGTGRHGGLDAAEGGVSAVHGALLAQRALQGAADPPRMGVGGPEGRVRHGVPGIRVGQGRDRRRGDVCVQLVVAGLVTMIFRV